MTYQVSSDGRAARYPTEAQTDLRSEILGRVDLAALVRDSGVDLRRAGRRDVGLCPFHAEKSPSFSVNSERGLFYCFGCGIGGSSFDFVMRIEGVTFREALRTLAARAGIALDDDRPRAARPPTPNPRHQAAIEREDVFDDLRMLWAKRADLTALAAGSQILPDLVLEDLAHLADEETQLIARFGELTQITNRRVNA